MSNNKQGKRGKKKQRKEGKKKQRREGESICTPQQDALLSREGERESEDNGSTDGNKQRATAMFAHSRNLFLLSFLLFVLLFSLVLPLSLIIDYRMQLMTATHCSASMSSIDIKNRNKKEKERKHRKQERHSTYARQDQVDPQVVSIHHSYYDIYTWNRRDTIAHNSCLHSIARNNNTQRHKFQFSPARSVGTKNPAVVTPHKTDV
jgi:membrane-associated HD superfamily phosphohydrolase